MHYGGLKGTAKQQNLLWNDTALFTELYQNEANLKFDVQKKVQFENSTKMPVRYSP